MRREDIAREAQKMLEARVLSKTMAADVRDEDGNIKLLLPHKGQQEVIDDFDKVPYQWLVSPNRVGKSALLGRMLCWLLKNEFNTIKKPKCWPEKNALMIVAVQVRDHFGTALFREFIEPFCDKNELKVEKQKDLIMSITHKHTGNHLVVITYDNESKARERVQGKKCHFVAVDEMPRTLDFVLELQSRVSDVGGCFLAAFTPLVVSLDIKKKVDSAELPYEKKYQWSLRDNPKYQDDEVYNKRLYELKHAPEHIRRARLYGDWAQLDNIVFPINDDVDLVSIVDSPGYSKTQWRHVVGVDPASRSKVGLVILAEHPDTHVWYVVKSLSINATEYTTRRMIDKIEEIIAPYWIAVRVVDGADANFRDEAAEKGLVYQYPYDKNGRRMQMIINCNDRLGTDLFIDPSCEELLGELATYRWKENDPDKVVNSKVYHVTDAWRYAVDLLPKGQAKKEVLTHDEIIYKHNMELRQKRAREAENKRRWELRRINFRSSRRRGRRF